VSDPTNPPAYRLTFEPLPPRPGDLPPAPVGRRLARLLKHALRALGLKCTLVEKLPAPAPGVAQAGPEGPGEAQSRDLSAESPGGP
jgi:hypothetical protein